MLAGLLNWPQANFASKVDLDPSASKVTVDREMDGGIETLELSLPALMYVEPISSLKTWSGLTWDLYPAAPLICDSTSLALRRCQTL